MLIEETQQRKDPDLISDLRHLKDVRLSSGVAFATQLEIIRRCICSLTIEGLHCVCPVTLGVETLSILTLLSPPATHTVPTLSLSL